jgi:hypothetical protein
MPTWCFKTAANHTRVSFTHDWYWQINTQHTPITITSTRLFPTIEACIADARDNGFRGDVEIPVSLTLPAMITCEEGDYVHGIVQRSVTALTNRRAVA